MKIHVYLLCYNEEKIISNIIDYYKQFASKIFILDNHSTDRSVEIANNYECVSIIPWKNESDKIDEAKYVQLKTQLYKNYSRKDGKFTEEVADWIISCDMDEVLYHPNIKDLLEGYTRDGVSVPKVTGFDMVGDNELDANLPIVDQYRLAERNKNFDKRIVFKASFDMAYSYGCHPKGDGFEYMKSSYGYVTSKESELALLHYKKIGSRYLEAAKKMQQGSI
jgi:glycosyltransferase involved in cell wall biosynthesis